MVQLNENDLRSVIKAVYKKRLNEERNNSIKVKKYISESVNISNQTIISVDIQPEYMNGITFDIGEWVNFIEQAYKNNNKLIFLYNGSETVGGVTESEYISWLDDLGLDEEILDYIVFYDKGYAFFRYCMDSGIDEDNITNLVKFMINNNINDSRDINKEMWDEYMDETNSGSEDVRDLLEIAGDMINIPELMDFLGNYNNIYLMGGGIDECLKEVEIALKSLDKDYKIINKFIY